MSTAELLETLEDFTSKENWDKFFTIRGSDDAFEWYAEWPALNGPLLSQLQSIGPSSHLPQNQPPPPLQILVPGCGSSRLSEHLYDSGFHGITNIDFSKVVISAMLRRNVRNRPEMKWRLMDMTDMQFAGGFFDAIIDKGGIDALMEPKLGSMLGRQYLKEVKRVLKSGGKFVCLTLAESHVIGLLFTEFRFGWSTCVHAIPQKHSKHGFQTFMLVFTKDNSVILEPISSLFDHSSTGCSHDQGFALTISIKSENKTRGDISSGDDVLYSLEDLQLGTKGDLKALLPGRRCQIILGESGESHFGYRATLLDSQQQVDTFSYRCGVFIVPKTRSHEWLFSSEEGQWLVVDSSKAARLIMVFLDSRHSHASMDDIQKDLSHLVNHLMPQNCDESTVPFLTAGDGVKQRNIIKKVTSSITGPIIIEDVVYEDNGQSTDLKSVESVTFRRLTFERSPGLVQSEGLLIRQEHSEELSGTEKKSTVSSKHGKKRTQKKNVTHKSIETRGNWKVDHSYLASSYHSGILSGFMLISSPLRNMASTGQMVKTIVIGLGAGLFPMCLHFCLPFLDIEVVELDPVVCDVAKGCFDFKEEDRLKVHVADGIKFIQERSIVAPTKVGMVCEQANHSQEFVRPPNGTGSDPHSGRKNSTGAKILIIDADSSDTSSGLTCPPADFLEESFLYSVKNFLSEGGLFVINLVSRSTAIKEMVISRMKKVFNHLFYLELEEDVNNVIFALPSETSIDLDSLPKMAAELQDLLVWTQQEKRQKILETAEKIRYLP